MHRQTEPAEKYTHTYITSTRTYGQVRLDKMSIHNACVHKTDAHLVHDVGT
jgi:hypothetical protein